MTKSGYRSKQKGTIGNPFDKLYIEDDFLFEKQGAGILGLYNWAKSSRRILDIMTLYLTGTTALTKATSGIQVGLNGTYALITPTFTTAQWNGLVHAVGMIGHDTDIDRFKTYTGASIKMLEEINETPGDIDGLSVTPSVESVNDFRESALAPFTITDFTNGVEAQIIRIIFTDGNCTVTHGTNIFLSGGANKIYAANETLVLINRSGIWYQIGGVI